MIYIIDANNLAGKIGVLFEDDFDRKLIKIVKEHFYNKKIEVNLVFDSLDLMGDKFHDENITVIYTPRDSFYDSADDMVVELLYKKIEKSKDEITLVTDDLEIIEKAKKIIRETQTKKMYIKRSTDFALEIERKTQHEESEKEDDRNLSESQVDDINNELLKIWQ